MLLSKFDRALFKYGKTNGKTKKEERENKKTGVNKEKEDQLRGKVGEKGGYLGRGGLERERERRRGG